MFVCFLLTFAAQRYCFFRTYANNSSKNLIFAICLCQKPLSLLHSINPSKVYGPAGSLVELRSVYCLTAVYCTSCSLNVALPHTHAVGTLHHSIIPSIHHLANFVCVTIPSFTSSRSPQVSPPRLSCPICK